MPLSTFNLYVEDYPESGSTLIHNTFSGAYVVLDSGVVDALRASDRGAELTAAERELADDPDLRDPDVAVVVASRAAEEAEFRQWFETRRARNEVLDVTVGVNLACNFACTYCCQAQVLDGSVMSERTADETADWLVARARDTGVAAIHTVFIGGEPLLHPRRIEQIARRIGASVAPAPIEFGFSLVTNGYFLTPPIVERLVPLGLKSAKVTLDGDESTHALTRVSKKGEDTFARIFDNVIAASRFIRITLNGNYQDDTIAGFGPLIRKLRAAGLPAGTEVSFSPALEGLSSDEAVGSGTCTWSGSNDYQVALADETRRNGFEPRMLHAVGPCAFHDHHHASIDPDGTLHKCPGFMGHPEWAIGNVRDGLSARYHRMLGVNPQRECTGCAHRPNCGGGCIAAAWLRAGRMEGVSCEHSYFERVKDASLVREYLVATSDDAEAAATGFPPPDHPIPLSRENALPTPPRGRRSAALHVLAA
jgi:uncharacterized protein